MTDWQPIETAPRDGTRLLMTDGENTHVCYPKQVPRPFSEGGYDKNGHCQESRLGDVWEYFRDNENVPGHTWSMCPTHWMPLPPPPSLGRAG